MEKFYAVGWLNPSNGQAVGQLENFRIADFRDKDGSTLKAYINSLQFCNTAAEQGKTLLEKFEVAITGLQNTETNGGDTDVPFFRAITENLTIERSRADKVTAQLAQQLNPLKSLDDIRLYIVELKSENEIYRFYIKTLRLAVLNTRFVITALSDKTTITDTGDKGKPLPYMICYAEKITDNTIVQYIFKREIADRDNADVCAV